MKFSETCVRFFFSYIRKQAAKITLPLSEGETTGEKAVLQHSETSRTSTLRSSGFSAPVKAVRRMSSAIP